MWSQRALPRLVPLAKLSCASSFWNKVLQIETIVFFFLHCLFQETWEPSRRRFIGLKCKPCNYALFKLMKMWFWSFFLPWSHLCPKKSADSEIYGDSDLRGQEVHETGEGWWQGDRPLMRCVSQKIILRGSSFHSVVFKHSGICYSFWNGLQHVEDTRCHLSDFPSLPSLKADNMSFYLEKKSWSN